jgi:large conductance mechanosensitive channel
MNVPGNVTLPGSVKGLAGEFRDFLIKQNALALAVGVVIGGAIGKVVTGLVDDIFMPLIGVLLPGGEWRSAQLVLSGSNAIKYGDIIGRLVDLFIVAVVIFFVVKTLLREKTKPVTTKPCPRCLENIPLLATRCRACTSDV